MKNIIDSFKSRFKTSHSGAAVLFVFGIIFIASVLMVTILEYASAELSPRVSAKYLQSLRSDAYSALNASIAVLEEYKKIDKVLASKEQGWEYPLGDGRTKLLKDGDLKNRADEWEYMPSDDMSRKEPKPEIFPSGNEVIVKISDECGKIPLSKMDENSLKLIFEEMGISSSKAQDMADCLLDWTDSNEDARINGAEYDDYDIDTAFPPNRPLRSFEELRFIEKFEDFFDEDGNPNEYYKRFTEIFSLENSEAVNLNSASEDVLRMMMEMEGKDYDESLFRAIRGEIGQISNGITWVNNATDITNRGARDVPTKLRAFQSTLLKIEIFVSRGAAKFYLCAYYGTQMQSVTTTEAGSVSNNSNSSGGINSKKSSNAKSVANRSPNSSDSSKLSTNKQSQTSQKSGSKGRQSSSNTQNKSSYKLLKIR